jgi:dTMP kinase
MNVKNGIFITFEGPEGCGKSTHAKRLYEHLKKKGYRCVYTREPGGTKLGEAIRRVLLDSRNLGITEVSELLLFEAARAQVVRERILPALTQGAIVICDRFSDATFAYQGYGGNLDLGMIRDLDAISTEGLVPDVTILLDFDPALGLKRTTKTRRPDRMERKPISYHRRVRRGYLEIARSNPHRVRVIRSDGAIAHTHERVRQEVSGVLKRYKRPR